jgi:hypothetical protein
MITERDLLWILAYPVYQTIGTLRHESAHALIVILGGGKVTDFVILPSIRESGILWGYVKYIGSISWIFDAAPYFLDLITFCVFFVVCMWVLIRRKWIWLNLVIIGLMSPFGNSLYNYLGGLTRMNDVGKLFQELPDGIVHAYFISTLLIYLLGIVIVFKSSKTAIFFRS